MLRRAVNILSPIAALAIVWVALQGFWASETLPAEPFVGPATSVTTQNLLPELSSVSHLLAATSSETPGETVPESVKRLLIANGAVLLVPVESDRGL